MLTSYILSHHMTKDYDRCVKVIFRGRVCYICSRCVGLYIGFLFFSILLINDILHGMSIILYLFPLPAIFDWSIHRFNIYQGTNPSRIITGFLLGIAYAGLLETFIETPLNLIFWTVILSYLFVGVLIFKLTCRGVPCFQC